MIIKWVAGGLGNQMFHYAVGVALAEHRRTILKMDVSWFREYPTLEGHLRYALSCFNVTEQFATEHEVDRLRGVQLSRAKRWCVRLARRAHLDRYVRDMAPRPRVCYPIKPGYYEEFWENQDNVYVHGLWQSERFFGASANLIRKQFTFRYPPTPAVEAMAARIRSGPSVAVHFRRGDYGTNPEFQFLSVLGLDYYTRAVREVWSRHPGATLYVFSNDIDSVEREFQPDGPHVFVRATERWNDYDAMRLMSLCDHAIIANSTFSWWAAWLHPDTSPNRIVVTPDPWFTDGRLDAVDLVPERWIRLAR